ncbi:ferritin-like domain-containing protein [Panaeolus papilionaceus]|nr:ferritin-like domain-containing protein [Panaeolus papilionaceus]
MVRNYHNVLMGATGNQKSDRAGLEIDKKNDFLCTASAAPQAVTSDIISILPTSILSTSIAIPTNPPTSAVSSFSSIATSAISASSATGTASGAVPSTSSPPFSTPPSGGLGVNDTDPQYSPLSDFDRNSLALVLHQEYIELDLFNNGSSRFSDSDFEQAGLDADDRALLQYMAEQEIGHAQMVSNLLGADASQPCTYRYPFNTVREFLDFSKKITRLGESGVLGFLAHLDSRPSANLLSQTVTTEARQQMIFRQFEGAHPMPVWFQTGITQSMHWTLLAPYINTCPNGTQNLAWNNFPGLNVTGSPSINITSSGDGPSVSGNNDTQPLTTPGRNITLTWELPGQRTGWNNSFTTATAAGEPKFVAWISQLNVTYTPLSITANQSGTTTQPGGQIYGNGTVVERFGGQSAPTVNETVFVAITDEDVFVTPFNLTFLDTHIVAGPAFYTSG